MIRAVYKPLTSFLIVISFSLYSFASGTGTPTTTTPAVDGNDDSAGEGLKQVHSNVETQLTRLKLVAGKTNQATAFAAFEKSK